MTKDRDDIMATVAVLEKGLRDTEKQKQDMEEKYKDIEEKYQMIENLDLDLPADIFVHAIGRVTNEHAVNLASQFRKELERSRLI
jgi:hypothetical protein